MCRAHKAASHPHPSRMRCHFPVGGCTNKPEQRAPELAVAPRALVHFVKNVAGLPLERFRAVRVAWIGQQQRQ